MHDPGPEPEGATHVYVLPAWNWSQPKVYRRRILSRTAKQLVLGIPERFLRGALVKRRVRLGDAGDAFFWTFAAAKHALQAECLRGVDELERRLKAARDALHAAGAIASHSDAPE